MKEAALVFLGGGAGSLLRYFISLLMISKFGPLIPWGTFTVNIVGCLLIGVLIGWLDLAGDRESQTLRLLVGVGFCGGFTTFSTFALDNIRLMQAGETTAFFLYAAGSLVLGLAAAMAGLWLGRMVGG